MNCSSKIVETDATIGSTFVFQFRLKDDTGEVIDITGNRVLFAAKSADGETLLLADSEGELPKITLEAETGATLEIDIPETLAPQVADFNFLLLEESKNTPVIRGKLHILSQIADATP
jgi:hypothetical protein